MHITIDTSSKTFRNFRTDDRIRPNRAQPASLSRTDYRRMVAEILG